MINGITCFHAEKPRIIYQQIYHHNFYHHNKYIFIVVTISKSRYMF